MRNEGCTWSESQPSAATVGSTVEVLLLVDKWQASWRQARRKGWEGWLERARGAPGSASFLRLVKKNEKEFIVCLEFYSVHFMVVDYLRKLLVPLRHGWWSSEREDHPFPSVCQNKEDEWPFCGPGSSFLQFSPLHSQSMLLPSFLSCCSDLLPRNSKLHSSQEKSKA